MSTLLFAFGLSLAVGQTHVGTHIDASAGGGGAGGVGGPASETSTDEAICRWDGVDGSTLQDSSVTLDDSGNMTWSNANGPLLLNEAATSTNPTVVPHQQAPDSGLSGSSGGNVYIVAGGDAAVTVQNGGAQGNSLHVNGDTVTNSTTDRYAFDLVQILNQGTGGGTDIYSAIDARVIETDSGAWGNGLYFFRGRSGAAGATTTFTIGLDGRVVSARTPGANNTDPTWSLGDGDTGLYEPSDDVLAVSLAGIERWEFNPSTASFRSVTFGGPVITQTAPTKVSPSIRPYGQDSSTGLGYDTANNWLTLIDNNEDIVIVHGDNAEGDYVEIQGSTSTASTTDDQTLQITATLNDTSVGGGFEIYSAIDVDLTTTDTTGWDEVNMMRFRDDGSDVLRVEQDGTIVMSSGAHLQIPEDTDLTTPAFCFGPGSCNYGFIGGAFADTMSYVVNDTRMWDFATTGIFSASTSGPFIRQTGVGVGSSIAFAPRQNDSNSGFTSLAVDEASIVAGGERAVRIKANATDIYSNFAGYYSMRQTFSYTELVDGGGTSGTLNLNFGIPDGAVFQQALLDELTGFTGDTTATIQIGDGSDPDRYMTGTPDVFTSNASGVYLGAPSGAVWHDATVNDVVVTVTTTSDFTNVSAGQATVILFFYGETPTETDPP